MDFDAFKKKYFRFWNVEDLPTDNTFDKYQKAYFHEKIFDVDVTDGQLSIDFQGENWACSVSAVVIFPVAKAAEGEKFLKYVEAKRPLPLRQLLQAGPASPERRSAAARPTTTAAAATWSSSATTCRRSTTTTRRRGRKSASPLYGEAFAGEYEPLTLALRPAAGPGQSDRDGRRPDAARRARSPPTRSTWAIVSYRISRVTMEGSVYTITPAVHHAQRHGRHAQGHHAAVLADGEDARRGQAGPVSRHGRRFAPENGGRRRGAGRVPRPRRHARPGRHPRRPVQLHDRPALVRRRPADRRVQPPDDA